jgi:hypothetical protein
MDIQKQQRPRKGKVRKMVRKPKKQNKNKNNTQNRSYNNREKSGNLKWGFGSGTHKTTLANKRIGIIWGG